MSRSYQSAGEVATCVRRARLARRGAAASGSLAHGRARQGDRRAVEPLEQLGADLALAQPDCVPRIFRDEVTDGMEGSTARWSIPDDSRRLDLEASKLGPVNIDQADVLVGVPHADLHPRQRFGLLERETLLNAR
jgi:hypothetical protein